jgi:hypothetical protein
VALAGNDDQRVRAIGVLVGAHGCSDPDEHTATGRISTPAIGNRADQRVRASTVATRADHLSLPETG